MQPSEARRVAKDSRHIPGWFVAYGLFALIDSAQRAFGEGGDLFEIGAHHGKSAVVLGRMAADNEKVGVCDIFGAQERNTSGSGSGDRAAFERNMEQFAPRCELHVHECLSSELTPERIGTHRFFHIDGGHLAEEARGDLELGADVTTDRGAIVIDDPYRIEWPGVTEAIVAFLTEHEEWAPVALGFNKLVLCRRSSVGLYSTAFEGDDTWSYVDPRVFERKRLPLVGTEATIFFVPGYRQIPSLTPTVARARSLYSALLRRLGR
jgi:hypothetical protein